MVNQSIAFCFLSGACTATFLDLGWLFSRQDTPELATFETGKPNAASAPVFAARRYRNLGAERNNCRKPEDALQQGVCRTHGMDAAVGHLL
jgi:hypothetical protein